MGVVISMTLLFLVVGVPAACGAVFPAVHWVPAWTASPQAAPAGTVENLQNRTLRLIVHTTVGGSQVRIRISNAFGTVPLLIGDAHVAMESSSPGTIVPVTDQALTFGGHPTVTIPVGAVILSDPVTWHVPALSNLSISLYVPQGTTNLTITEHATAQQASYVSSAGDFCGAMSIPNPTPIWSWYFLTGVDVMPLLPAMTVVALGDSITDGVGSTINANNRWTDLLATNLNSSFPLLSFPVANQGIAGNRILNQEIGPDALARFDEDILSQPGVAYLIVEEGLADIAIGTQIPGQNVSANQVIFGLTELIQRGHKKGLIVFVATLTPFEGSVYYTADAEKTRQAVNVFIRSSNPADAVFDFDQAVRDHNHPAQLLAAYDSGDHLHPNDAGYHAIVQSIKLSVFQGQRARQ
jgi:lysophospholipase L1-like esterase